MGRLTLARGFASFGRRSSVQKRCRRDQRGGFHSSFRFWILTFPLTLSLFATRPTVYATARNFRNAVEIRPGGVARLVLRWARPASVYDRGDTVCRAFVSRRCAKRCGSRKKLLDPGRILGGVGTGGRAVRSPR